MFSSWKTLRNSIEACRLCPRLVAWREETARAKTRRFLKETYWGRPVPGFGDVRARLLLVGLAPAAHGANRTGRMFTGDRSGEWLYRALHKAGFANRPFSEAADDGLRLRDCYITAACRCAPPQNRPEPPELRNCRPYLMEEFRLLGNLRVVVGLGKTGFDAAYAALSEMHGLRAMRKPRFSHGCGFHVGPVQLLGSFHPSQQNTFTGRLTEPMLDAVFTGARAILAQGE